MNFGAKERTLWYKLGADMATITLPDAGLETAGGSREDLAPLYNVVFHNDDATTMEFVVFILVSLYRHEIESAVRLMYEVHNAGSAVVATLPLEVAELKKDQTHAAARSKGYPLTCTIEPA